jgi:endonuclease/exonuclease/phosphatase (EEP) superfamily protein YafD
MTSLGALSPEAGPPQPPQPPPHGPPATTARTARQSLGLLCHVVGWLIVGFLLLVALFRLVAWDDLQIFAMLDAAGSILYFPAWAVGIAAGITRKWLLLAASVLVVAAQLGFGLPELTAATPVPAAAAHAFKFRVFDANVDQSNPSMGGYAQEIKADHPDLVTLEEANPGDRAQLEQMGAFHGLPHLYEVNDTGSRAFVIASRYPLGPTSVTSVYGGFFYGGLPYLVRTSLELPRLTIPLWVVHTTPPIEPRWENFNTELDQITQFLEARRAAPLLMVGDFNATWGNRGFRAILDRGMTDAAAARGDAFAMTWSQNFFLLPPIVRFDHVLTNSSLAVTTISTLHGPGSDHRALEATVAVLPEAYPTSARQTGALAVHSR